MAAEDVEAIVRASANFGGSETDMAALSFIDPGGSGDEFATTEEDPFTAMGVKIVPENVSNVAKSDDGAPGLEDGEERFIAIAKGQSFRELLEEAEVAGQGYRRDRHGAVRRWSTSTPSTSARRSAWPTPPT